MVDIREVIHQDRVVAAVMTFYFRDQVLPYYGASDPAYNSLAPNNYMYTHSMTYTFDNYTNSGIQALTDINPMGQ